ncbi:MAG: hypothetical protein BWK75_00570 [Candidatus Altiarchaeales archaeon A3]|nr:MAG: hypothetical protein BWK75_00570 [Candidatus Altiarchaeales archaeon A3]
MSILSDDIGSFPLPNGISRNEISLIAEKISCKEISEKDEQYKKFSDVVQDAMLKKVFVNVDVPTYPQFRDMIASFYNLMAQFQSDEPFVIKDEYAIIPELLVLSNDKFREKLENFGIECINLRVCITGPVDLYLNKIGFQIDGEILANFAKSVGKFVKNAIIDKKFIKTTVIAIDEPSVGLNSNMIASDDDLINGWNIAIETAKRNNIDTEIHLHSVNKVDTVLKSYIDVIDADVENLKDRYSLQKKDLERYDKFMRAGIAKSNVFDIVEDYKKADNIDLWATKNYDKIFEVETQKVISNRLNKAYKIYGERIKYAGPTCGLGSWPTQESASKLLQYSANAVHGAGL